MATVTSREVARRAGVSVSTVSNVLNRPEIVAPRTRQRVFESIRELGYVRNEAARHLRVGRSRTIGLVVMDIANPFFTDVAHGVEQLADSRDSIAILCNSGGSLERELRVLEQLREQRVLGILIAPIERDYHHLDNLVELGIPTILVDRGGGRNLCSVAVDDVMGGRLAGTHFVEQGHRSLAFVGGPLTTTQVADRLAGLRAATSSIADLSVITTPSQTVADGYQAAEQIASRPARQRPTAAFCANDLLALGFLQRITQAGMRVPNDIAIIGYDDIPITDAAAIPMSSVRSPREQLGRTAVELLFAELEDREQHEHRHVMFHPELIIRESSSLQHRPL